MDDTSWRPPAKDLDSHIEAVDRQLEPQVSLHIESIDAGTRSWLLVGRAVDVAMP
jgi:hypothetical protein